MNRDGDVESAAAHGARRAFAAISHELASPLSALQTFLKLSSSDERVARCLERIRAITELARELSLLDETARENGTTDIVLAIESAAARLSVGVELATTSAQRARIAPSHASTIMTALLRAVVALATSPKLVARVEQRGDRIWARIDPGLEPAAWRVVEPWQSGTGFKLDLWAAAVAAGNDAVVRVGDADGQIAVEIELPAAEAR